MIKQFHEDIKLPEVNKFNKLYFNNLPYLIKLAESSEKFLLPDSGRLYDDPDYKALDENEELKLPFNNICLEYFVPYIEDNLNVSDVYVSKRIILAQQGKQLIRLHIVNFISNKWLYSGSIILPIINYLDRSLKIDGRVAIRCSPDPIGNIIFTDFGHNELVKQHGDEIGCFLSFLNILRCSNVKTQINQPKKTNVKLKKDALPFDSYHILTIDLPHKEYCNGEPKGDHRSPREHLRRGHIRRLNDGRRVWVNTAVINPGVVGTVKKDYKLRLSA